MKQKSEMNFCLQIIPIRWETLCTDIQDVSPFSDSAFDCRQKTDANVLICDTSSVVVARIRRRIRSCARHGKSHWWLRWIRRRLGRFWLWWPRAACGAWSLWEHWRRLTENHDHYLKHRNVHFFYLIIISSDKKKTIGIISIAEFIQMEEYSSPAQPRGYRWSSRSNHEDMGDTLDHFHQHIVTP